MTKTLKMGDLYWPYVESLQGLEDGDPMDCTECGQNFQDRMQDLDEWDDK